LNYLLITYVLSIILILSFSLAYPLELYPIKRELEEKAIALDYLAVANALSLVSKQASENDLAPGSLCDLFNDTLMDEMEVMREYSDFEGSVLNFTCSWNGSSAYARVFFNHPWGTEVITVFLSARVEVIRKVPSSLTAHRLVIAKVELLSDRPVDVSFYSEELYVLNVHPLPDQTYLLRLFTRSEGDIRLYIIDERGITLVVTINGNP